MRQERAALMRIASLLCALAGLAELAACRSPAVRGFVIWLLRRAEVVALDFVVCDADVWWAAIQVTPTESGSAEAMRLAASFRALGRELEQQAALLLAMGGDRRCGARLPLPRAMTALGALVDVLALPANLSRLIVCRAPDTS